MRASLLALASGLFMLAASLGAAEGGLVKVSIPVAQNGELVLEVPAGWKQSFEDSGKDRPKTLTLTPAEGKDFEIKVSPLCNSKGETSFKKPLNVRAFMERVASKDLAQAAEKEPEFKEIKGVDEKGLYFILTDKAPKPGEYLYLFKACIGTGRIVVVVTAVYNEKSSYCVERTLKMLEGARQSLEQGSAEVK